MQTGLFFSFSFYSSSYFIFFFAFLHEYYDSASSTFLSSCFTVISQLWPFSSCGLISSFMPNFFSVTCHPFSTTSRIHFLLEIVLLSTSLIPLFFFLRKLNSLPSSQTLSATCHLYSLQLPFLLPCNCPSFYLSNPLSSLFSTLPLSSSFRFSSSSSGYSSFLCHAYISMDLGRFVVFPPDFSTSGGYYTIPRLNTNCTTGGFLLLNPDWPMGQTKLNSDWPYRD